MKKMTVKKLMSLLAVCLWAVCLLSGCGGQGEQSENTDGKESGSESAGTDDSREMVLFTWEGMFPQEVLDGFEEETGIQIVYSNFDTDETMLEKLAQAEGGLRSWTRVRLRILAISIPCIRDNFMIKKMPTQFPTELEFH